MEVTTWRRASALLVSAASLAALLTVSAGPVVAEEDDEQPAIGIDAFEGLGANEGGGDEASSPGPTGDLDNPLEGASGDASPGSGEGEEPGAEGATVEGAGATDTGATDTGATSANPMFQLMADLILSEVQRAQAEAAKSGSTLTEAEKVAIAKGAARDLITFMQQAGLLGPGASGDENANDLLRQIEAIPTDAPASPAP